MWAAADDGHRLTVTAHGTPQEVQLVLHHGPTGCRMGVAVDPAEVYALRVALSGWLAEQAQARCPRHFPVQRHDGRRPWCVDCGADAEGAPVVDPAVLARGLS